MKKVTFKGIEVKNFCGIASYKTDFNESVHSIAASNASGKTSIMKAAFWVLGQAVGDGWLPSLNNKEIDGKMVTSVELKVGSGDFNYALKRVSKGKFSVDKLTGAENKVTNESTYFIDGIEMTQKNYFVKIADIFGIDDYANLSMLINKDYFNTDTAKWGWQQRRKLLLEICGTDNVNDTLLADEEFADIKEDILKGYATADIKSTLLREKKGYKAAQDKNVILIEQKQSEIAELLNIDFAQIKKDIKKAETALDKITKATKKENQTEELTKLQAELNKAMQALVKLQTADLAKKQELNALANNLYCEASALGGKKKKLYADLEMAAAERDAFISKLTKQNELYSQPIVDICNACGQKLPADKVNTAKDNNAKLIAENNAKIETAKKDCETLSQKINAEILAINTTGAKLKADYETAKAQVENFKPSAETEATEDAVKALQAALSKAKLRDMDKLSAEQETALKTQITALTKELGKEDDVAKGKAMIEMWQNESKDIADKIMFVERKEQALKLFVEAQVSLIEETVNSAFGKGITFSLFDVVMNGGEPTISENCRVMLNGTIYSSMSSGEKIKTDMAIVSKLQDYYSTNLPIWCDNFEQCTFTPESDRQLILMSAVKGKKIDGLVRISDFYKGEK